MVVSGPANAVSILAVARSGLADISCRVHWVPRLPGALWNTASSLSSGHYLGRLPWPRDFVETAIGAPASAPYAKLSLAVYVFVDLSHDTIFD